MNISENKVAYISYTLTNKKSGEILEKVDSGNPQPFLFGTGYLLEAFEKNLTGLKAGDRFSFILNPNEAYGIHDPESVVEIPKDVFTFEGKIDESLFEPGNQIPMRDDQGNKHLGVVISNHIDFVVIDFNHPLAGKTLQFTGEISEVRDAYDHELNVIDGCSCGGSCDCGGHHHHSHPHDDSNCQVCGNPPELQGQGAGNCKCS